MLAAATVYGLELNEDDVQNIGISELAACLLYYDAEPTAAVTEW